MENQGERILSTGKLVGLVVKYVKCIICRKTVSGGVTLCEGGHLLCKESCHQPTDTECNSCQADIIMEDYNLPQTILDLKRGHRERDIWEELSCGICFELMKGETIMCVNKHTFCAACVGNYGQARNENPICALDRGEMSSHRNRWLEIFVRKLTEKPEDTAKRRVRLSQHTKEKLFGLVKCPFFDQCQEETKIQNLYRHFAQQHATDYLQRLPRDLNHDHILPINKFKSCTKVLKIQRWGLFQIDIKLHWATYTTGFLKARMASIWTEEVRFRYELKLNTYNWIISINEENRKAEVDIDSEIYPKKHFTNIRPDQDCSLSLRVWKATGEQGEEIQAADIIIIEN